MTVHPHRVAHAARHVLVDGYEIRVDAAELRDGARNVFAVQKVELYMITDRKLGPRPSFTP